MGLIIGLGSSVGGRGGSKGLGGKTLNHVYPRSTMNNQNFIDSKLDEANLSEVTDLSNFFFACPNLTNINLTKWNASTLTNINGIFGKDTLLTSIVGDLTIDDIGELVKVLEGLKLSLDVAQTSMTLPSLAAIINGLATLEIPQTAMVNFSVSQYNVLEAYTDIDYIQKAKDKGWLVGLNGQSDELIPEEIAGTIIGKDTQGNITFVKYTDFIKDEFDITTFTPISVLVIPKSHTADGKCRGVSLVNMDVANPETGAAAAKTMVWGPSTEHSLTNRDLVTTGNVPLTGTLGVTGNAYLPTDKLSTTASVVDTIQSIPMSYYGSQTPFIPSPYGAEGIVNTQCRNGMSGNTRQANTEMDGWSNCQTIIENYVRITVPEVLVTGATLSNSQAQYPAFVTCYRYQGGGYTDHSWYLPSCGEMCYYIVRWGAINSSLTAIKNKYSSIAVTTIASGTNHWSSTEYSSLGARLLLPSTGYVLYNGKNTGGCVRPFHAF